MFGSVSGAVNGAVSGVVIGAVGGAGSLLRNLCCYFAEPRHVSAPLSYTTYMSRCNAARRQSCSFVVILALQTLSSVL